MHPEGFGSGHWRREDRAEVPHPLQFKLRPLHTAEGSRLKHVLQVDEKNPACRSRKGNFEFCFLSYYYSNAVLKNEHHLTGAI